MLPKRSGNVGPAALPSSDAKKRVDLRGIVQVESKGLGARLTVRAGLKDREASR